MIKREEFEKMYECNAYSIYTKGWDAGYAECCVDTEERIKEAYKNGQHDGFIEGYKVKEALSDFAKAHPTPITIGDEVVMKNSSAVGVVVKVWQNPYCANEQCVNVLSSDGEIYNAHSANDYDKIGHYEWVFDMMDIIKSKEMGSK